MVPVRATKNVAIKGAVPPKSAFPKLNESAKLPYLTRAGNTFVRREASTRFAAGRYPLVVPSETAPPCNS